MNESPPFATALGLCVCQTRCSYTGIQVLGLVEGKACTQMTLVSGPLCRNSFKNQSMLSMLAHALTLWISMSSSLARGTLGDPLSKKEEKSQAWWCKPLLEVEADQPGLHSKLKASRECRETPTHKKRRAGERTKI